MTSRLSSVYWTDGQENRVGRSAKVMSARVMNGEKYSRRTNLISRRAQDDGRFGSYIRSCYLYIVYSVGGVRFCFVQEINTNSDEKKIKK